MYAAVTLYMLNQFNKLTLDKFVSLSDYARNLYAM